MSFHDMNAHVTDVSISNLKAAQTVDGKNLFDYSFQHPLMVVFLRHFGCTFCREAMRELGKLRPEIEAHRDTHMVLVHMSPPAYAEKIMEKFGLQGVDHISDPDRKLYHEFGLKRGDFNQLFGLKMWIRGFQAGVLEGLWVGRERGDGFQMPGYFLLYKGKIIHQYIPADAADHPDFLALAQCDILVEE